MSGCLISPSHDPSMPVPVSFDGSPGPTPLVCREPSQALPLGGGGDFPPEYSDVTSSESKPRAPSRRTPSFFQGASHFSMQHANFSSNMHVVTINQFHGQSQASHASGQCRCSATLPPLHTQDCAHTSSSSHVVASLNTPTQRLRFEFSQDSEEIGSNPSEHQTFVDRGCTHIEPQFEVLTAEQKAELLATKQASDEYLERLSTILDVESPWKGRHRGKEWLSRTLGPPSQKLHETAVDEPSHGQVVGEALVTIFGENDSRGIPNALRDFTSFQHTTAGGNGGQLVRLRSRFLPHYNGLSQAGIGRLDTPIKVTIARVVQDLHRMRRASGLCQPLTFETIQSRLSQLVFLQTSSGDATTSFRVVKCHRGPRVAPMLTDTAKYIVKVVESEEPDSILDEAFTIPKARKKQRGDGLMLPSRRNGTSGNEDIVGLVDLTVLCFPRSNVPRFKLCHLLMKCFTSKQGGLSSKAEVGTVVEYTSHFYHIRDGVVPLLTIQAQNEASAYADHIFSM